MYSSQNLVSNIKYIAKAKNILIRDMLTDCGLNINTLSQLSDKKGLSSFALAKIADYLDCSVDGLLGRCPLPEIECIWDSDVLVKLRNDSGYTVNYVASAVGMRPQEYELLERGRLNPPADVLIRLSELFTCEVDYLLGRSFEHIDQEHGTKKRPILSSEAQKIAMDYDTLDDYGKNAVRSLTTAELDRVREAFSPTAGNEQVG